MGAPKIQVVSSESQADYNVYIVNSDSQQKNHQVIVGGKLVTSSPTVKIYLVKSESQADIKITQKNFPKG